MGLRSIVDLRRQIIVVVRALALRECIRRVDGMEGLSAVSRPRSVLQYLVILIAAPPAIFAPILLCNLLVALGFVSGYVSRHISLVAVVLLVIRIIDKLLLNLLLSVIYLDLPFLCL